MSIAPVRVSRVNRPWTLPWPSSHIVSRVAAAASRSSRSSSLASWASAASGATTSSSRRPNRFKRPGVEVLGLGEQVRLGVLDQVGVEVGGEVVEGAEDDLGLLDVHPPLGERLPGQVVGLEPGGEPDVRCAAGRVVLVWWASQFAVEVAPDWPGDVDAARRGRGAGP